MLDTRCWLLVTCYWMLDYYIYRRVKIINLFNLYQSFQSQSISTNLFNPNQSLQSPLLLFHKIPQLIKHDWNILFFNTLV